MKIENESPELPTVTTGEVAHQLPKSEAILLRLTVQDKLAITRTAKKLHLTATEYLVKCHAVISAKIPS
jgi:hypothetical protein